ncbi:MAG: 3-oxoacyl-[acyl-carrier-protein] reductase [Nitrospirae bacterium]|nr:3-oxoacyl-[acyl-carrier-protein] reductase [Nitrospirota bacterium]
MTLQGKVAIVTGGAQGIGRQIALTLANAGADVVISDVQKAGAEETATQVTALGRRSLALQVDVTSSTEVEGMVRTTVDRMGRLDILVCNAGITRDTLLIRMKEDDWNRVLDVNLKGAFLCMKAAAPILSKQRGGRIIAIASVVAVLGNVGQANYAASKAGLIGLTKTVAREYASRGITVNAVAPGFIDTAMTRALSEKVREELLRRIPLGRLGTPEDVAAAVRFLASDAAGYLTGQVIHVNGGMYM